MIMKIAKVFVVVVTVAVAAFFVWNYLAGPLKYRRDMQTFADLVENCDSGSLPIRSVIGGMVAEHTVVGRRDGRCALRIETMGPHVLHCSFPSDQLGVLAKGFSDMGQAVGIFGGTNIRISTSNPDPLTEALNSDACEARAE